jgi:hypothetical protein
MSTLESKLNLLPRTFTPDPTDPNSPTFDPYFLAAVIARQRMTTDKFWGCGSLHVPHDNSPMLPSRYLTEGQNWQAYRSCWMGHLLFAFSGSNPANEGETRAFAQALGFPGPSYLYHFNDTNPHHKVLQRFDEGLANWQTPNLS